MRARQVAAVIWDFDGTLADTMERNRLVTKRIVDHLAPGTASALAALRDRDSYGRALHTAESWRHLYVDHFGLPIERTEEAQPLWYRFHAQDPAPAPLFPGVSEVLGDLDHKLQGIVSQNGREPIGRALASDALTSLFGHIVADEDLPAERQKPEPDGLLNCAEHLVGAQAFSPGDIVLYVGDHAVDIECVRRARRVLNEVGADWTVESVGAEYGLVGEQEWLAAPDHVASAPGDLPEIISGIEA